MKCEYGCGKEAKFQLKNNKWCCKKSCNGCSAIKLKNSNGIKRARKDGKYPKDSFGDKRAWSRGLTKETDKRVRMQSEKVKEMYRTGKLVNKFKHHTKESKLKISNARIKYLKENGIHVKWYELHNGQKNINVQGKWEKSVGEYLINENIKWDRIKLSYNNGERSYTPDFYLLDFDIFVEVKGWMRERDKYKMWKVLRENKNIIIKLVDSLTVIKKLYEHKISILELEDFVNKYTYDSIDFSKFNRYNVGG